MSYPDGNNNSKLLEQQKRKDDFDKYRMQAGVALKQRLGPAAKRQKTQAKFAKNITTRLVDFDEKKNKYTPREPKQMITIMCDMEFDTVHKKIWNYYKSTNQALAHITQDTHVLKIITGLFGPVVNDTDQLDNKRDLLVIFTAKPNPEARHEFPNALSVYDNSRIDNSIKISSLREHGRVTDGNFKKPVAASVFPKITPSRIKQAAKVIEAEADEQPGHVKRLIRTTDNWLWLPEQEVKLIIGKTLASGSFRDAIEIVLTNYGELPKCQYVLKLWNDRSVSHRKEELGDPSAEDVLVTKDLSQRAVQCQLVAAGLAQNFAHHAKEFEEFGETLEYIPSYMIRIGSKYGTLEPKLEGEFVKYMNNSMGELLVSTEFGLKAAAFAHFTLSSTNHAYMVTDCQGSANQLTDPEIASLSRSDDDGLNFGFGNLGADSFASFQAGHQCNCYCKLLKLEPLN